jgi:hypothetical protein
MIAGGMSERAYAAFATETGYRIDFSRKMRLLTLCRSIEAMDLLQEWRQAVDVLEMELESWQGLVIERIRVTESCWRRWGDVNCLDRQARARWIRKEAMPLDVACMEISEVCGRELDPSEAADFMASHPKGERDWEPAARVEELASTFKSLAGFRPSLEFWNRMHGKKVKSEREWAQDCPF